MVRGTHPTFVLLHSPLVGPVSWDAVRRAFYQRAYPVSVPTITSDAPPYWRGYVDRAAEAITDTAADEVVLVAHSGAGALIAAIADMAVPEVSGIVFVDATLPADGRTRLEEMEAFDPAFAVALRTGLDRGGRYPDWTDATLTAAIPSADLRAAFLADMHPRALDFFEEPIPAPNWPGPQCGYLRLSPSYDRTADEAERSGWPVVRLPLNHFATITHAELIASTILGLYASTSRTT